MNPSIQKDLFTLEKQERAMNLKFGVIYAKESQMTDDEFLSNQEGSKDFYNFLDLFGERINLKVGRNEAVILGQNNRILCHVSRFHGQFSFTFNSGLGPLQWRSRHSKWHDRESIVLHLIWRTSSNVSCFYALALFHWRYPAGNLIWKWHNVQDNSILQLSDSPFYE